MAYIKERTNEKTGERVFMIKASCGYTIDGKQVTKSMTWKPAAKMSEQAIQKEVNRQAVLFEEKIKHGEISKERRVKFAKAANDWLEYERQIGEKKISTIELYEGCKERTYKAIGHIFLDKITKKMIQDFILDLADGKDGKKPLAFKSQKNYICFISNVFNFAMDSEHGYNMVMRSPCTGIKAKKTEQKEHQFYTLEEQILLFDKLDEANAPLKYRLFYHISSLLGTRKGEALGIEWKDVDFVNSTIFIQRTSNYRNKKTGVYTSTPKTDTSTRKLQVSSEIIDLLRLVKAEQAEEREKCGDLWIENDRVFRGEFGKLMFPSMPYNYLKNFCKRWDLPFKALHSFRHGVVTELLRNGVEDNRVSRIVGHKNTFVTRTIYNHEIKDATVIDSDITSQLIAAKRKELAEKKQQRAVS